MAEQKVHVKLTGHGRGQVWVDGVEVKVRAVTLSAAVDTVNICTIELIADSADAEGLFEVTTVGSSTREYAKGKPG